MFYILFSGVPEASGPIRDMLSKLERIADTPLAVLITGENGTGKALSEPAIMTTAGGAHSRSVSPLALEFQKASLRAKDLASQRREP